MNTPTKLTISRIVLSIIIIVLMIFPYGSIGIDVPVIRTEVDINFIYVVCCILFIVASFTDFLDGYLARKYNQITNRGKMLDAIADKILVNPILIVFASEGIINPIIPIVVVVRDIVVNALKMELTANGKAVAAIASGKVKTASIMLGIILLFVNDIPFIYINLRIDLLLITFGTIMSLISMYQYYKMSKDALKNIDTVQ